MLVVEPQDLGHTGDEYNTGGARCGDATQIIAPGMSLFEPKHERGKSDQGALSAAPGEPEPGMSRGPLDYLLACCAHIDTEARLATDGISAVAQLATDRYNLGFWPVAAQIV